jgi:signal transduction histidine kinase
MWQTAGRGEERSGRSGEHPDSAVLDPRFRVFFAHYVAMILAAMVWVQLEGVRTRPGTSLPLFYALCSVGALYVSLRAYLESRHAVTTPWQWVALCLDILFISGVVGVTGGYASEAGLLYFWPLAVGGIRRRWAQTLSAGVLSGVAYCVVAWAPADTPPATYLGQMETRLGVLVFATSLASWFGAAEAKRLEEVSRLREQVALAGYREGLSREMHDGIQHYLVSIGVQLEVAAKLAEKAPEQALATALDQRFTVRQAAEELRYLVRRLRAEEAESRSFGEAVRTHLAGLSRGVDSGVQLEVRGDERPLPPESEHAIFRILQEAVTNAAKHGGTGRVRVALGYSAEALLCSVRDDGPGFDPSTLTTGEGEGLGLASMRERASSIGAELSIGSKPGEGTEVHLRVPLEPGDEAQGGDTR